MASPATASCLLVSAKATLQLVLLKHIHAINIHHVSIIAANAPFAGVSFSKILTLSAQCKQQILLCAHGNEASAWDNPEPHWVCWGLSFPFHPNPSPSFPCRWMP